MARPKRVKRTVYLLEKAKRRIFLPLECKEYIKKAITELNNEG